MTSKTPDRVQSEGARGEAPLERKEPIEALKWGRRELIRDLKDSFSIVCKCK